MTRASRHPDNELARLADTLRTFGYDIEPEDLAQPAGRNLVARRDLGDRSILVVVDASGRFRAQLTWSVGEWPSSQVLGGMTARVVDSVTRAVEITAALASPAQAAAVVADLGTIAPWAAPGNTPRQASENPPPPP